jgi:hypothetical protein
LDWIHDMSRTSLRSVPRIDITYRVSSSFFSIRESVAAVKNLRKDFIYVRAFSGLYKKTYKYACCQDLQSVCVRVD